MPTKKNSEAAPKSLSLSDLASRAPRVALLEKGIDVSDLFGAEEGEVVFRYRQTDVPAFFRLREDAAEIKRRNPELTETLATEIAMLATCHVAPINPGDSTAQFYLSLALANEQGMSPVFAALVQRFEAAFAAQSPEAALVEAKND
jgi:hypothetical protein